MTQIAERYEDRTQELRERLQEYQKNGGSYKAVENATGVSRTAISMLANHGVALPTDKLNKVLGFLDQVAPNPVAVDALDAMASYVEYSKPHTHAHEVFAGGLSWPVGPVSHQHETVTVSRNPVYKTSVGVYPTDDYKKIMGWCAYIFKHRKIGAMIGYPGSGKTTILREYAKQNPAAHYIECWPSMRMSDLLDLIGETLGMTLRGTDYRKGQQVAKALAERTDVMLLIDECENLKKRNVEKYDMLRKIWDDTGMPIVLCGTPELVNILTRGTGRENCAQLYRRLYKIKLCGIKSEEAEDMLRDYNIDPDAAGKLVRIATDYEHGGIGNMSEILQIALETAEGGQIDRRLIEDAKAYKLTY